jgi:hypothetical protein
VILDKERNSMLKTEYGGAYADVIIKAETKVA